MEPKSIPQTIMDGFRCISLPITVIDETRTTKTHLTFTSNSFPKQAKSMQLNSLSNTALKSMRKPKGKRRHWTGLHGMVITNHINFCRRDFLWHVLYRNVESDGFQRQLSHTPPSYHQCLVFTQTERFVNNCYKWQFGRVCVGCRWIPLYLNKTRPTSALKYNLYSIKSHFNLGHVDTIRLLIEKGAEIDAKGILGRNPLHCAAYFGNSQESQYKDTFEFLIPKQAKSMQLNSSSNIVPMSVQRMSMERRHWTWLQGMVITNHLKLCFEIRIWSN